MRISTKLRVGYIFSALVVILAGAIIIASFKQLHNAARELRVIDTVMQGVFELDLAGHEFLLHQEKRPETQWGISYQALSRLLGQENLLSPNHRYLMDKLREDLGHANTLFSDFVSRQTSANAFPEGELSRKIQNRLQSQLLLKTQRMLSHATQLKHQIEDELFSIQRYTNWIIITLIIATALLAIISGYVISRSIIVPVRALLRGTKIIGSGNLEFRLKTDRRDEIGQLSESFDQMANDLNTVMISRDDLESKIAKRTVELTASNRRLSSEIEERKQAELELQGAFAEIKELKDQLETERTYLQEEIKLEHNFENIIGQSEELKYVLYQVEQVATTDSSVLILGETGTGKELIARAIHKLSPRSNRVLVKVNCAALPADLIESELFGREKGAFTGATATQIGRFELAKGSTLFLDEIGELPLALQAKLLRVFESGEFERLGNPKTLHSDARIIAATNRNLEEEEVRQGKFREDLWYRLKVFTVTLPPLRQRQADIPLLIKWFMDQLSRKMGKSAAEISEHTIQALQDYHWPGNVRELKNTIESALITAPGNKIKLAPQKMSAPTASSLKSLEEMERDYILQVLKAKNWKIQGTNSAAFVLEMNPNTLRARIKKLGIKKRAAR